MSSAELSLYHFEARIRSLGPGLRAGVWVQGCSIGCPGCLVSDSHEPRRGESVAVTELAERILGDPDVQGVTVSGGEPFEQMPPLLELLWLLRQARQNFSVMLYSGYRRERLERSAYGRQILSLADILIDGPFRQERSGPDAWRGSDNQRIHFLSDRHGPDDVPGAVGELEFMLRPGGGLFMVGVPPRGLWDRLEGRLLEGGDAVEHAGRRVSP